MSTDLSRENLLAANYREHRPAPPKHADAFFQKRVLANGKTRYFINLYFYRFPDGAERWHGELNTHLGDGSYIDLGLHACSTVEAVEDFFNRAFIALNGRDYDDD